MCPCMRLRRRSLSLIWPGASFCPTYAQSQRCKPHTMLKRDEIKRTTSQCHFAFYLSTFWRPLFCRSLSCQFQRHLPQSLGQRHHGQEASLEPMITAITKFGCLVTLQWAMRRFWLVKGMLYSISTHIPLYSLILAFPCAFQSALLWMVVQVPQY